MIKSYLAVVYNILCIVSALSGHRREPRPKINKFYCPNGPEPRWDRFFRPRL